MKLFGKKKDPLDEPDPFANDQGFGPQDPFNHPLPQQGQAPGSAFPPMDHPDTPDSISKFNAPLTQTEQAPHQEGPDLQKDLSLIIAKIDAVKSELDAVNIRLMKIERTLEGGEQEKKRPPRKYANVY